MGEPISVHYDTHLTLKVEGIIQMATTGNRVHMVHMVQLLVYSDLQSRAATLPDSKVCAICSSLHFSVLSSILFI